MRLGHRLACIGCAAAISAPYIGLADTKQTAATDCPSQPGSAALTQRSSNPSTGNILMIIGAVILVGGLGNGSGAAQVLTLGAGGFLVALGFDGRPSFDPNAGGLHIGVVDGVPAAGYTLFRF